MLGPVAGRRHNGRPRWHAGPTQWCPGIVLHAVLFYLSSLRTALAQCHQNCNGHGLCNTRGFCECYPNWQGFSCAHRTCPFGTAWADMAVSTDNAHAKAECSNRGDCNRVAGLCECFPGFWGPSCNRMDCPNDCSGHGRCMSLAQAAEGFDGYLLNRSTTYSGWEAEMVYGCVCDRGFTGYDCSLQPCSIGPDPRTNINKHETVTIKCRCDSTCSGTFRLSYEGRTSSAISPSASNTLLAKAIMGIYSAYTTVTDTEDYSDMLNVDQRSGLMCADTYEAQTDITFVTAPSDVRPLTVHSYLSSSTGTAKVYMETTQELNCTCGYTCAGTVSLVFDGVMTEELPYYADANRVKSALQGLSTMQSAYSLDVAASGSLDQLCGDQGMTGGMTIVIGSQMGNLPALQVVSSLLVSGQPGGNITVTTNDGDTPTAYCNGIGECDFTTGTCTCPIGFGSHVVRGDCGALSINSSGWTGIESCPGNVDQTTLKEITGTNPAYAWFTSDEWSHGNKSYPPGIFLQEINSTAVPRLMVNMTGIEPGAIALDLSERVVYWLDKTYNTTGRQTIDMLRWYNTSQSVQYSANTSEFFLNFTSTPNDIALDLRFGIRQAYVVLPGTAEQGIADGEIIRANLDGSPQQTVILSGLEYPTALALDLSSEKLYYTTGRNTSFGKVFRADLDGGNVETVATGRWNLSMPTAIALDLNQRKVFVADRTAQGRASIMSFDMDANTSEANATRYHWIASNSYYVPQTNLSDTRTFFTTKENMLTPEHLMIDTKTQYIYYTDSSTGVVRRVNYMGTKASSVVPYSISSPVGLALDLGYGPPLTQAYYECFGHGYCTGFDGEFTCECFDGWQANCNIASCPVGRAWFDQPLDPTTAHGFAECSNRGVCDHGTGTCICQDGFEGSACQRLSCPGDCSGHGRCMTMSDLALQTRDSYGRAGTYTYGDDPSKASTWDAGMLQGCLCDSFGYMDGTADRLPSYYLPDCSQRLCPAGDNPNTRGGNESQFEVQHVGCYAVNGTFTLSFDGAETEAIDANATVADVQDALTSLPTLGRVQMSSPSSHRFCSRDHVASINITFTTELGSQPLLTANDTALAGFIAITRVRNGTKDSLPCANHGYCDGNTGQCMCAAGWSSSDYQGGVGDRGECGYKGSRSLKRQLGGKADTRKTSSLTVG